MSKAKAIATVSRPLTIGGLRSGAVQLSVSRKVKAEQVHAALDKIFEMHGCITCGLNGLDILFRHSTPINDAFQGFEGIVAVEQFGY